LDREPWEQREPAGPLEDLEAEILGALGMFGTPAGGAVVATTSGILRSTHTLDRAILDLAPLHDGEVLVPAVDRQGWDARALALAWADSAEAEARRLGFFVSAPPILRRVEERDLADADLAELHDAPDRLEWLAARLLGELGTRKPVAILLPPWLGVDQPRAESLSSLVGVPCGEALSGLAGPSGARFERARDRALRAAGVLQRQGRVAALSFDGLWHARLDFGETLEEAAAVVLATGGLVGGGLDYCPSGSVLATELPPSAGPLLRSTVDVPVVIGIGGVPLETPSSLFGASPESLAWPFVLSSTLEHAGVLVDAEGRVRGAPPGLHAAGDLVADRPRTWLEALSLGARAGRSAAAGPT